MILITESGSCEHGDMSVNFTDASGMDPDEAMRLLSFIGESPLGRSDYVVLNDPGSMRDIDTMETTFWLHRLHDLTTLSDRAFAFVKRNISKHDDNGVARVAAETERRAAT